MTSSEEAENTLGSMIGCDFRGPALEEMRIFEQTSLTSTPREPLRRSRFPVSPQYPQELPETEVYTESSGNHLDRLGIQRSN